MPDLCFHFPPYVLHTKFARSHIFFSFVFYYTLAVNVLPPPPQFTHCPRPQHAYIPRGFRSCERSNVNLTFTLAASANLYDARGGAPPCLLHSKCCRSGGERWKPDSTGDGTHPTRRSTIAAIMLKCWTGAGRRWRPRSYGTVWW